MLKLIITFLILILLSCQETLSPIIPPNPFDEINNYKSNLTSNAGSFKDNVTISWNKYLENDFQDYRINNTIITNAEENEITLTLGLNEFINIDFNILNIDGDTIINENLEIFTRPIIPVDNFQVYASDDEWISKLKWDASNELEFERYRIYRSSNSYEGFNDLDNCDCIIIDAPILEEQNTNSFDDVNTVGQKQYFYTVVTFDVNNNHRNSFIKTNTDLNSNTLTSIDNFLTTNTLKNKIKLSWDYLNFDSDIFYHTEIYRSSSYDGI